MEHLEQAWTQRRETGRRIPVGRIPAADWGGLCPEIGCSDRFFMIFLTFFRQIHRASWFMSYVGMDNILLCGCM
jgi:hypothetical protein